MSVNPIVTDQYTDDDTGLTHIYLRQRANGLPVDNTSININIAATVEYSVSAAAFVPGL